MISKDTTQLYDPDCSTCAHRVERHPSKRSTPAKPTNLRYVCLVTCKAIGEHGCWTQTRLKSSQGFHAHELGKPIWVQDVPCRAFDRNTGKWFALDYSPRDST